ncbi:MAG: phosphopantothenoylcysteine decarboxylase [Pseudomonadota bacterium]|nr:phosphopantothenoylcysteine decarboxylase [Pseudomonadota bacterium]
MACGEFGAGRMPEPPSILARIAQELDLDLDLPELAAPTPAQLAAPLAGDKSPDEGPLSEDWAEEPEMDEGAEDAAPSNGGLGGLLSMIIPRTTETRTHDEIEAELEALPEAEEEAATEEPLDLPAPDPAAGPILATKGKAAAAPPTDPSALAYDHGAGLQSVQTQSVTFENSPLAGQGAFDPDPEHRPLYGKHVLITAGPTREPIDPVRYIANRSSGKQGFAIAAMAAAAGARVTLIAGPVHLPTPVGVDRIDVETAEDMAEEVRRALPVDIAFMVAAVADWKSRHVAGEKMKKRGSAPPALILAENPDILASTAAGRKRPTLLIGFVAETENVVENAKSKRKRKGADWIVANNVAGDVGESVMGGDLNQVHIVTAGGVESLPEMAKEDVARELVLRAAEALAPVEESDD